MSSGDIRAGGGYVELSLRSKAFYDGLKRAVSEAANFSKRIAVAGAGASAGFAAATIGLQGGIDALKMAAQNVSILGLARSFADAGSALEDLAQRSGFAASELSQLQYVGALNDFGLEDLQAAGKGMSKFVSEALSGSKAATEALKTMKVPLRAIANASQYERFRLLVGTIGGFADPAQRAAMAMTVFGKSALALMPTINAGVDAMDDQIARARELGLVMSGEDVQAAAELGDTFDELRAIVSGLSNRIGAALAPAVRATLQTIGRVAGVVSKWVQQNKALISTLASVISSAGLVAAGITIAAGAFAMLAPAVPMVAGLALKLAAVGVAARVVHQNFDQIRDIGLAAWRSIANLSAMAIDAMGDNVRAFINWASDGFKTWAGNFSSAWESIVAAVGSGDLAAAFQVVTAAMDVAWVAVVETMRAGWNELTGIMERAGFEVSFGFAAAWAEAFASISQMGLKFGFELSNIWADVRDQGASAWAAITAAIRQAGYQAEILKTAMFEGFGWVPKGTTTQTIRDKFAADNAATAAERQAETTRAADYQRDREQAKQDFERQSAEIEARRAERLGDVERNRNDMRRENENRRAQNADGSAGRLKEATDAYAQALERAKAARPGSNPIAELTQTGLSALSSLSDPLLTGTEKQTARGTFSGFGAAVGSVDRYGKEQAELLGQIHDVLRGIDARGLLI